MLEQPSEMPIYSPPDPRMKGRVRVFKDLSKTEPGDEFYMVDLAKWQCECSRGSPYFWSKTKGGRWQVAWPCTHKIKAFAALIEEYDTPADLSWLYIKSLGPRYNVFEVVSAFHKELRRGDFSKAYFWGMMLAAHRGGSGVIKYLLNITYEETRDHWLAEWLLKNQTKPSQQLLALAIELFCNATKKWFLAHRREIFKAEMKAYSLLADEFSDDIGRSGDIVPWEPNRERLHQKMTSGADSRDLVEMQFGLKGLQKAADVERVELRAWLAGELYIIGRKNGIEGIEERYDFILRRRRIMGDIRYHEINMLADLVSGEPYRAGIMPASVRSRILRRPHLRNFPFGVAPAIPLYAHDNHDWTGKRLLKTFRNQTLPEMRQTDIDLRYCGAYLGVGFRMLSVEQHNAVVEWHKVTWPKKLYNQCNRLWY